MDKSVAHGLVYRKEKVEIWYTINIRPCCVMCISLSMKACYFLNYLISVNEFNLH